MNTAPNVVIITLHDTGRHFHCYGVKTVQSPNIDALATDGIRFTRYFTTVPVCSPSRGVMLTGRYPQSNGLMGLTHGPWDWSFNPGERHLSHLLQEAGYRTALFGIQHESADVSTLGFDDTHAQRTTEGVRPTCLDIAASFRDFAQTAQAKAQPFYAQIGFFETHRPHEFGGVEADDSLGVTVPPYIEADATAVREFALQQGAVRRADEAVGIISQALLETGLDENTILVFTVDHGIEFPRAKWFCYDAGIEIAFIIRWPGGGIAGGQTCDWLLSNVDFLPTLFDLIDIPIPDNVQGESFSDALKDVDGPPSREAIYGIFQSKEIRFIRTDRYKLIRNFAPRRLLPVPVPMENPPVLGANAPRCPVAQLFNLETDPLETINLAEDPTHAHIFRTLDDKLWSWLEDVGDPILQGPVPTPYYRESIAGYQARRLG
jgi:N-sulfoglucosamine sulfohydrolase